MDLRRTSFSRRSWMHLIRERILVPSNRHDDQVFLPHCMPRNGPSLNTRTTTTLTEALNAFVKQLELSSVAEINQDCLSFLKDCTSNTMTFKNLYGNLLALATVYGEKLDDCVIADKKKMRKDFGV